MTSCKPRRKSISKKTRFMLFKRDAFTCQYCGRTPPNITLEIDHIIPVKSGGTNDEDNLIVACFDCNRGKSAEHLTTVPETVKTRTILLKEQNEQAKQYVKWLDNKRRRQEIDVDSIQDILSTFHDSVFTDSFRVSVKHFLKQLPLESVQDAMEQAASKKNPSDAAVKYFCGICWNKIKRGEA